MHGAADEFGSHEVIMNAVESETSNDPENITSSWIFKSRLFCAISYASWIILVGVMPCGEAWFERGVGICNPVQKKAKLFMTKALHFRWFYFVIDICH